MTAAGTISHEFGHYTFSKVLGYDATINYNSTVHWNEGLFKYFNDTYEQYSKEIRNNKNFPGREKYLKAIQKYKYDNFLITLGGPLQTMITGSVGLISLIGFRNKLIKSNNVTITGWLLIFMSLFWLRQVANLFVAILTFFNKGKTSLRGDEMQLAIYLDINVWSIQVITGVFGLIILFIVVRTLPQKIVLTFLFSGLIGGLLGSYLWFLKIGPLLMP